VILGADIQSNNPITPLGTSSEHNYRNPVASPRQHYVDYDHVVLAFERLREALIAGILHINVVGSALQKLSNKSRARFIIGNQGDGRVRDLPQICGTSCRKPQYNCQIAAPPAIRSSRWREAIPGFLKLRLWECPELHQEAARRTSSRAPRQQWPHSNGLTCNSEAHPPAIPAQSRIGLGDGITERSVPPSAGAESPAEGAREQLLLGRPQRFRTAPTGNSASEFR
jgi:hypothetical protein